MPIVNFGTEHYIMDSPCGKSFHKKSKREVVCAFKLHMRTCKDCGKVKYDVQYNHNKEVVILKNTNTDWRNFK